MSNSPSRPPFRARSLSSSSLHGWTSETPATLGRVQTYQRPSTPDRADRPALQEIIAAARANANVVILDSGSRLARDGNLATSAFGPASGEGCAAKPGGA